MRSLVLIFVLALSACSNDPAKNQGANPPHFETKNFDGAVFVPTGPMSEKALSERDKKKCSNWIDPQVRVGHQFSSRTKFSFADKQVVITKEVRYPIVEPLHYTEVAGIMIRFIDGTTVSITDRISRERAAIDSYDTTSTPLEVPSKEVRKRALDRWRYCRVSGGQKTDSAEEGYLIFPDGTRLPAFRTVSSDYGPWSCDVSDPYRHDWSSGEHGREVITTISSDHILREMDGNCRGEVSWEQHVTDEQGTLLGKLRSEILRVPLRAIAP